MDVLRARSDAVIVGSRTVNLDGWAIRVRDAEVRRSRLNRGRSPHPLNVVMSTQLNLPPNCQFFSYPRTEKLIITTREAPKHRIRRFEKYAEVFVLPASRIRPRAALRELQRRGCKRILVEGGGELNFSFLSQKLVDELYITITPRILGGRTAPTPVDGKGLLKNAQVRLQLASSRRHGDELFVRYRVIND